MRRLFQYLGKYRLAFNLAVVNSILNKLLDLMPPFLTAWLIDALSGSPPGWIQRLGLSDPWPIAVFLAALTVLIFFGESLFEWLFKRGFMRIAQNVQHDLRVEAYASMQNREMAFFENQRTGNLMAMLNDDVNQLERFINNIFNEILQLVILVLVAGWALCDLSLSLGLIGMAPIPFIIAGSFYYQRKVAPLYRDIRENVGQMAARLENNISGMLVIKSFAAETYEIGRVREASAHYRNANFNAISWSALFIPVIRMFIAFGFALTLLIGAYWVIYEPGKFTLGGLAFFAMMTQRLLWPVTRLGVIFDEYERARASARRIFGLLDSRSALQEPEKPLTLPPNAGDIVLDQISFTYPNGLPVLNQISLHIQAGQTIGIAGPTGGGKTTLIKLLLRLYDVNSGAIRIEGIDIRQLALQNLRGNIGLVSQDVYLFHGTIRENIAYGQPDASPEAIVYAARKAQLHEFISSLPQGYDTLVGERGIKLSGGQRQRLSIARAILKNPPILILDEATSSVDTETERAIQENLHELTEGKTAIIIAHRLSTIRQADRIVVLKDGIIAETGTHRDLLAKNGVYADLWKVQTGEPAQAP